MKNLFLIILFVLALAIPETNAQHRARHAKARVVVVKHSRFRPRHVVVFHPRWHPRLTCNRRWVYFPRHNFYWDNWRNRYVFYSGTVWVSKAQPPSTVGNINLADEKFYELDEADDDNDAIT